MATVCKWCMYVSYSNIFLNKNKQSRTCLRTAHTTLLWLTVVSSSSGVWGNMCSWQHWAGLCFCFMALSCWRPEITLFALVCSRVSSLCIRRESWGGKKRRKVRDLFSVHLRDVSVPQGSDWWILGPPEGGHEEGPQHCGWGRHDSHLTGCFPWTCRCSSAHMQQRVSIIPTTCASSHT